jgi:aromatic-L-amino-acid decarboxylase
VCLRPRWADDVDADVATMTLLERLNDGGEVFLTHTTVGGTTVLRVAIGSPATAREHVERVWALLREGHDWLAADFAAAAAEQAAARAAERARADAERETRLAAEAAARADAAQQDAVESPSDDLPAVEETALALDETDSVTTDARI